MRPRHVIEVCEQVFEAAFPGGLFKWGIAVEVVSAEGDGEGEGSFEEALNRHRVGGTCRLFIARARD